MTGNGAAPSVERTQRHEEAADALRQVGAGRVRGTTVIAI
jgi:hypothetical protein